MGLKKLIALFFAATFILVVAVRLNIEQMYLMSGVLVAVPGVSLALGWLALRRVDLTQSGASRCFEGDTTEVRLTLASAGTLSRGLLSFHFETPRWVETRHLREEGTEDLTVVQTVAARRRGAFRLGPAVVSARDPLGIRSFRRRYPVYSDLVVYPLPQPVPSLLPAVAGASGAEGDQSTEQRGGGVELHSTREYRPGDELRRIHWPSTARANRLVVVERHDHADSATWLALDTLAGSELGGGRETTLDVSCRIAAWLATELLKRGDAVGLLTGSESEEGFVAPGAGMAHYYRILESLARAEAGSRRSLAQALAERALEAKAKGTLVFFCSSPDQALLEQLVHWRRERGGVVGVVDDGTWGKAPGMPRAEFAAAARGQGIQVTLMAPPVSAPERRGGRLGSEPRAAERPA